MYPNDLQTVVEDLDYLRSNWGKSLSDPEARRGSAILRRLMVEDAYGQSWRAVGFHGQPTIIAVDLKSIISGIPSSSIDIALAGGTKFGSVFMAGLYRGRVKPLTPGPPITPDGFFGEREFKLNEYLASQAGVVGRHFATRKDVIKYFANIKGGVHLGRTGKKDEAKLVDRMEKFDKRVRFFKKDGLLVELIAIGQALARSPDTATFLVKARQLLLDPKD